MAHIAFKRDLEALQEAFNNSINMGDTMRPKNLIEALKEDRERTLRDIEYTFRMHMRISVDDNNNNYITKPKLGRPYYDTERDIEL